MYEGGRNSTFNVSAYWDELERKFEMKIQEEMKIMIWRDLGGQGKGCRTLPDLPTHVKEHTKKYVSIFYQTKFRRTKVTKISQDA